MDDLILFGTIALIVWSTIWKSWALWVAATRREKKWFIFFCIFNTAGILEIIYIYLKNKDKKKKPNKSIDDGYMG